jgi:hypothetical protein
MSDEKPKRTIGDVPDANRPLSEREFKLNDAINQILRVIALVCGAIVVGATVLDDIEPKRAVAVLGIGLFSLAIVSFQEHSDRKKRDN